MRSRLKFLVALVGLLLLSLLGYRGLREAPILESPARAVPPSSAPARELSSPRLCVRVIDGDTLELEGGERVRLIGVDTPESVDPRRPSEPFGEEAAGFTRRLAEGKSVRLESGDEARDAYGRSLAYIHLPDGTLLNAEIIRQGYGRAYTRFPHPRLQEFVVLEREAREAGRGIWGR